MPAKRAWLPAEMTEVRMTEFMKEAAASMVGECEMRLKLEGRGEIREVREETYWSRLRRRRW